MLFLEVVSLSLYFIVPPSGADSIRPQEDTSSIANHGNTSASTLKAVTNESARKAEQQTSIMDKNRPMVTTD
jgi:hypothetical protein